MKRDILNIVVAGICWEEKWLLIKRRRGDYLNKWALVGGKLEKNEELKTAILREIEEETGLKVEWKGIEGLLNERLIDEETGKVRHFMIILCKVIAKQGNLFPTEEGELKWFSLEEIISFKEHIIPSDYYMITELLLKGNELKIVEIEMKQRENELELTKIMQY